MLKPLIQPLPRLWTPRETYAPARCPRCRRPVRSRPPGARPPRPRPFWRGGVRALNMADGDVMLDASGNVILDASGNVLLDDGLGCASCCTTICTTCQTTSATVTLAAVSRCFTCYDTGVGGIALAANISGTFTVPTAVFAPPFDCGYTASAASPVSVVVHDATGAGCSGAICSTTSTIILILARNSSTGKWGFSAEFGAPSGALIFSSADFDPPGTDNYCWTKSVSNTLSCPAGNFAECAVLGADDSSPYFHGGTATITVG